VLATAGLLVLQGAAVAQNGNSRSIFRAAGSDTTYDVSLRLCSLFNQAPASINPDNTACLNDFPTGSSAGIRRLGMEDENGPTALARSSREARSSDRGGLTFSAFAVDGIVPTTFGDPEEGEQQAPSTGLDDLTREQIKQIFITCEIRRFDDSRLLANNPRLAANPRRNAEIIVFATQRDSGTRATFDLLARDGNGDGQPDPDTVGRDSESCTDGNPDPDGDPNRVIFENSASPIFEIEPGERGRALFYFSFGRLSTTARGADENINTLSINGVEADADTLSNRTFPFNRNVFNVVLADPSAGGDADANRAAQNYVDFVCGRRGAGEREPNSKQTYGELIDQTIRASGFGPLENCLDRTTPPPPGGGQQPTPPPPGGGQQPTPPPPGGGQQGRRINGDSRNNVLVGTPGNDVINCGSGNDRVDGRGGNDVINCGSGDDIVAGGEGDDRISGGSGNDRLGGGPGNDRMSGGSGRDTMDGGSGADTMDGGSGNDTMRGGSGTDRLRGGSGRNSVAQ